jgi:hypothetical protein
MVLIDTRTQVREQGSDSFVSNGLWQPFCPSFFIVHYLLKMPRAMMHHIGMLGHFQVQGIVKVETIHIVEW